MRFEQFLPKASYPIRSGVHSNTAFAVALACDYAISHNDATLKQLLTEKVIAWYEHDAHCHAWEPSLNDFLSPTLIEAECMRRVLPPGRFREWLMRFLPEIRHGRPETLFRPPVVSDRCDGQIAHLDGLNFSRAWCWRGLASAFDHDPALAQTLRSIADAHLAASLPHISAHYAGEHWLATFAMLAMTE